MSMPQEARMASGMFKRERYKVSVSVFLFLKQDSRILMLKRAHTGWMDDHFSVPAGAIDGGETLADAVAREAREEVAATVDPSSLQLVHTMHCFTAGQEWLGQYFVAESWQGEPKINEPDKHSDLQWVEISALPDMTIPYVKQAVECYMNEVSYSSFREDE